MSYARFAQDSDVYVFFNSDGFYECQRCRVMRPDPWLRKPTQMVAHLELHRMVGHKVPDEALEALREEAGLSLDPSPCTRCRGTGAEPPPGVVLCVDGTPTHDFKGESRCPACGFEPKLAVPQ